MIYCPYVAMSQSLEFYFYKRWVAREEGPDGRSGLIMMAICGLSEVRQ